MHRAVSVTVKMAVGGFEGLEKTLEMGEGGGGGPMPTKELTDLQNVKMSAGKAFMNLPN